MWHCWFHHRYQLKIELFNQSYWFRGLCPRIWTVFKHFLPQKDRVVSLVSWIGQALATGCKFRLASVWLNIFVKLWAKMCVIWLTETIIASELRKDFIVAKYNSQKIVRSCHQLLSEWSKFVRDNNDVIKWVSRSYPAHEIPKKGPFYKTHVLCDYVPTCIHLW